MWNASGFGCILFKNTLPVDYYVRMVSVNKKLFSKRFSFYGEGRRVWYWSKNFTLQLPNQIFNCLSYFLDQSFWRGTVRGKNEGGGGRFLQMTNRISFFQIFYFNHCWKVGHFFNSILNCGYPPPKKMVYWYSNQTNQCKNKTISKIEQKISRGLK